MATNFLTTFPRAFLLKKIYNFDADKLSLNSVLNSPIDNIAALNEIMAWRQPGVKPLAEPMMMDRSVSMS